MKDEMLPYYESELIYLRQMGAEFAAKYPKIASRLQMSASECADPHVERLIESFALLAGRIRHKLDDEFPEITEAMLNVMYPHYLRPVPPMAIAQFKMDPSQSDVAEGTTIPAGTPTYSRPQDGSVASFRTCYPVKLWPVKVVGAAWTGASTLGGAAPGGASYAAKISLKYTGALSSSQVPMDRLRFYLQGDGTARYTFYELLFTSLAGVLVRPGGPGAAGSGVMLPSGCIRPVGFSLNEGVLPYSDRSFPGYRLLQEYFHFPEKFLFFDLDLSALGARERDRLGKNFEIVIFFGEAGPRSRYTHLEQAVGTEMFQLGCAPIVNLFERLAEPVRLAQTRTEYRIIPDQHRLLATEVYSVNEVTSTAVFNQESHTYEPFYSLHHQYGDEPSGRYWIAYRRGSLRPGDKGTEVHLSLVNAGLNAALPPVERLSVRVTCTNRDFAAGLPWHGVLGELDPEGMPLVRARCIRKPTESARPPLGGNLQWRLISHLSLNHLSIAGSGKKALQEILRLYDFTGDIAIRKHIDGLVDVSSESSVSRVISKTGVAFCRGVDVTLEFDESQFTGSGAFLMAAVMERFLALYSSINSFSRLTAKTSERGVIKQWAPRAGDQILI
ncbi:MAG: type VI secretion system baseplate subunit TssF [Bryobacteraceae bacterium]